MAKASISDCLGECITLRTINLLSGDHWKNFLRHISDPLQTCNTKRPERQLALTPVVNHGRAVFHFCEASQIHHKLICMLQ